MPQQMAPAGMLQLKQRAMAGDPEAIEILQQVTGQGMPTPQQPPMAPPQGAMTQSQFGNGQPVPPDVQAKRAQELIKILRATGRQ